ncbi:MAG: hypothetical protein R2813_13650 [Flavobacteriales bacterium]
MKSIHLLSALFLLWLSLPLQAQNSSSDCPPEGRAREGKGELKEELKEMNRKKNRDASEPDAEPVRLTFDQFQQGRTKTDDHHQWEEGQYVELSGAYLIDFKQQKGESCNCYEADTNKAMGDIHINLGTKADMDEGNNNHYMIVEITPTYKAQHPNVMDELKALEGKEVLVRGYLFYDHEHERNSINYCKKCSDRGVWRKSCWEVHPVTFIGAKE